MADLITAGVTCYNAAGTVERAVRSARAQAWAPLEIVVVDDASSDGSADVLARLAGEVAGLRVVRHQTNRGVAAARNTVIANARGAFLAFFDDDDESQPQRLAEQHRRITDYERATNAAEVACYTATEQRYPDGAVRYSPALGMDVTPAPAGMDVARLILLGKPVAGGAGVCPTSSLMARTDVFRGAGGFDESLRRHEDTDFNLRLALRGAHFPGLSAPLVAQTVTVAPDKTLDVDRANLIQFTRKHRELLRSWNWYDFNMRWCEMKFDLLEHGLVDALPHLVRLFFTSPSKFVRKAAWSLPNRRHYRKYDFHADSRGRNG